jgi:hypothetical protein
MPSSRDIYTESGEVTVKSSEETSCLNLNESTVDFSTSCLFHFGEQPISFRAALKRYLVSEVYSELSGSSAAVEYLRLHDVNFPINQLAYGDTGVAHGSMNLFSYLKYAYLGYRGGFKKRVYVDGKLSDSILASARVSNGSPSTSTSTSQTILSGQQRSYLSGTINYVINTNGGIEYEVPFYTSNLFAFSMSDDPLGNESSSMVTYWNKHSSISMDLHGDYDFIVSIDTAAGEDFTFGRFQGSPAFTV